MEEARAPLPRQSALPEGVLARAAGLVLAPASTLRTIETERAAGEAVLVTLVGGSISGGAALASMALTSGGGGALAWALSGALVGLALGVPFTAAWAGLCHAAARLLGQRGAYAGLFTGYGYVNALAVLQAPVALLGAALRGVASPVSTLLGLAVGVWGLVLMAIAIRENYGAGTGTAVATMVLAAVFGLVTVIGVVLIVVILLLLGLFALLR